MCLKYFVYCIFLISAANASCSFMRAYEESRNDFKTKNTFKNKLINNGFVVEKGQPASVFFYDDPLTPSVNELYTKSSILLNAEQIFSDFCISNSSDPPLSNKEKISILRSKSENIPIDYRCKKFNQTCSASNLYRSYDGSCNNLKFPKAGASYTAFTRMTPAVYDDGIHAIRKNSITNMDLVSTMEAYEAVTSATDIPKHVSNYAGVTFGQFIAHDVGLRNQIQNIKGGPSIRCCSTDYNKELPKGLMNYGCEPIKILSNDSFYSPYNITCMNFIRSQTIFPNDCHLGAAELANVVTHFIDSSNIYGSDETTLNTLRSNVKGQLKVDKNNILPRDYNSPVNYYLSGDSRANQHPTIALINSIFLRFHNMAAQKLFELNPDWNDDKLFLEAKRLENAVYQSISYSEWLPLFLGQEYSEEFNITCKKGSLYCGNYQPNLEPGTLNEFAQGSFRFFHTFVPPQVDLYNEDMNLYKSYNLSDVIQKPYLLETSFNGFLYGMLNQKADYTGVNVNLQTKLFNNYNKNGIGIALFAHDIMRSRDHGVAPYYVYQELCTPNTKSVETWKDLELNIAADKIEQLKQIYDSPFDVDLPIATGLETILNGHLGTVTRCITATQFYTSKHSDRFFYSFPDGPYPFKKGQMKEINSYSFANLLCDTTDIKNVPVHAFEIPGKSNIIISCNNISSFSFDSWKE